MKKLLVAAMMLAVTTSSAYAESMIMTNPLVDIAGVPNVEYQSSLSKTTGWTAGYGGIAVSGGNVSYITATYKSAFGKNIATNRGSTFGNGFYWRAGLLDVTAAVAGYSLTGIGPVAAVGYDYKVNKNFVVSVDVGLLSDGLQIGYAF